MFSLLISLSLFSCFPEYYIGSFKPMTKYHAYSLPMHLSLSLSLSLFNIFLKRSKMEKEKNFSFVPYFCVTLIMNNLREGRGDLRSYNNQLQTSLVKCLKLIWIIHLMTKISVAFCSLIYLFFTFSCAWYVISGYGKERERQERASI